eukprot:TRINITY_DN3077_c0_g1_i2.p1 TRINITY_DN3077_c0_g1~~TRINITY_DN3077_c0_g1_i2.p1  ORF type:complete len:295 (-),score=53.87 TRINITY_DN3077_c0_g1_i2:34-918(-)
MASKVAVVTGANKGIGLAIVRHLLLSSSSSSSSSPSSSSSGALHVYLTSRDASLGKKAVEQLSNEDDEVKRVLAHGDDDTKATLSYHQLDITDEGSIISMRDYLKEKHSHGIDILINNAGVATKGSNFDADVVKFTLPCNYWGTLKACEHFMPLIKRGGRIVNISSRAGAISKIVKPDLREKFQSKSLTLEQLNDLMRKFENDVASGSYQEEGWPSSAYGVSKIGVTALTRVLAKDNKDILINACCPGWVRTDMAGPKALLSTDQGAETPVHLALADIGGTTGELWAEKHVISW